MSDWSRSLVTAATAAVVPASGSCCQCKLCPQKFTCAEELEKHRFLCHAEVAVATAAKLPNGFVLSSLENQSDSLLSSDPNAAASDSEAWEPPVSDIIAAASAGGGAAHSATLPPTNSSATRRGSTSSRPRVSCQSCHRTFARRSNLNAHLRNTCPAGRGAVSLPPPAPVTAAPPAAAPTVSAASHSGFICQLCGNRYTLKSSYNRHLRRHKLQQQHHQQRLSHQSHRDSRPHSQSRDSHIQEKRKPCCPICRGTAADEVAMIRHLTFRHSLAGQLRFCSVCREVCVSRAQLRRHSAAGCHRDASLRPYNCAQCDRRFAQLCQLTAHAMSHTGAPRPHRCPLCPGAAFRWRFQLVEHSAQHDVGR